MCTGQRSSTRTHEERPAKPASIAEALTALMQHDACSGAATDRRAMTDDPASETVFLNGCRFEISRFDPSKVSLGALTELLHAAYKQLADIGLRFVASYQDEASTCAQLRDGICFVAQTQDELVGTILYYTVRIAGAPAIYHESDVAVVGKFAVLPKFQHHGLGNHLLSVVESFARQQGKKRVVLDTSEQAGHLIAYYQRRGYVIVGRWDRDLTNYTSVVMTKEL